MLEYNSIRLYDSEPSNKLSSCLSKRHWSTQEVMIANSLGDYIIKLKAPREGSATQSNPAVTCEAQGPAVWYNPKDAAVV